MLPKFSFDGVFKAPAPSTDGPQPISLPETRGLAGASPAGQSFNQLLNQFVSDVSAKSAAAGEAVSGVITGENVPLHQAMIAMEEASVSFQLMVEVRNKLLESYQELMRMQV
jgi:flagellar hook-basal body complex protein FliE